MVPRDSVMDSNRIHGGETHRHTHTHTHRRPFRPFPQSRTTTPRTCADNLPRCPRPLRLRSTRSLLAPPSRSLPRLPPHSSSSRAPAARHIPTPSTARSRVRHDRAHVCDGPADTACAVPPPGSPTSPTVPISPAASPMLALLPIASCVAHLVTLSHTTHIAFPAPTPHPLPRTWPPSPRTRDHPRTRHRRCRAVPYPDLVRRQRLHPPRKLVVLSRPSCPYAFPPHQRTPPPSRTAHVSSYPADSLHFPHPGTDSDAVAVDVAQGVGVRVGDAGVRVADAVNDADRDCPRC